MKTEKDKINIEISRNDLPALYQTATIASSNAQKNYLISVIINICFLSLGAISSAINLEGTSISGIQYIFSFISAISLIISIFLTIYLDQSKFEKKWYDGRAIAESVKTISWRFMMNSRPYSSLKAESLFLNHLNAIKNERKSFGELMGGENSIKPQITDIMRKVRTFNFEKKRSLYIKNRINKQKIWYSNNCLKNKSRSEQFFKISIFIQILSVIGAFLFINNPYFIFNPTGVFTTIVAGLLAWTQVKQYKTLAESYGLTTQELGIIEEKAKRIKSPIELSIFVNEAETAISREHTVWLARRVNI